MAAIKSPLMMGQQTLAAMFVMNSNCELDAFALDEFYKNTDMDVSLYKRGF
jgi:hypothetical protein